MNLKTTIHLEASRAPVNELNGSLGLDAGNSSLNILRHDITTVKKGASHCAKIRNMNVRVMKRVLYFPSLGSHLT